MLSGVTSDDVERRVALREYRALGRTERAALTRAAWNGDTYGDPSTQLKARRWAEVIAGRRWVWPALAAVGLLLAVISVSTRTWWLLAAAALAFGAAMASRARLATAHRYLALRTPL